MQGKIHLQAMFMVRVALADDDNSLRPRVDLEKLEQKVLYHSGTGSF